MTGAPVPNPPAIPPLWPYKADREHWSRTALDILRNAHRLLSVPDLAHMVIEGLGRDLTDRRLHMSVLCRLHATLGKLEGDVLEGVGDEPKRRALVPAGGSPVQDRVTGAERNHGMSAGPPRQVCDSRQGNARIELVSHRTARR